MVIQFGLQSTRSAAEYFIESAYPAKQLQLNPGSRSVVTPLDESPMMKLFQIAVPLPIIVVGLLWGCVVSIAHSDDAQSWVQFHGPSGLGVADSGVLPDSWNEQDYSWTVDLEAVEVGSPVIDEQQVYLLDTTTHPDGTKTIDLVAIDLQTGQLSWRQPQPLVDRRRHSRNTPASTTPVIDGDRIFFAYGDAEGAYVQAYSTSGDPLWSRSLGRWTGYHGFGTSPMVYGSKLILFNSQQADKLEDGQVAGQSQMVALDVATGEDVWTAQLETTRPCYGVPAIYQRDRGEAAEVIAANTGNGMFGLDLANGNMNWSLGVFDKRSCSSPLVVLGLPGGDLAIGSSGSGGGGNVLSAVRIPQTDGEEPTEAFRITKMAPYVPTSVVKGDLLFTVSDSGIACCFDLSDEGARLWSERLGGNFGASPIVVGEKLLLISLGGTAHVAVASRIKPTFSQFELGGTVGATPAFARDRLLLRAGSKLHCLATQP